MTLWLVSLYKWYRESLPLVSLTVKQYIIQLLDFIAAGEASNPANGLFVLSTRHVTDRKTILYRYRRIGQSNHHVKLSSI